MKLWGGRFTKKTDKLVEKFNESFSFDRELYEYDIQGSIIHTEMLAKCSIIDENDREKIIKGLNEIKKDIQRMLVS